MLTGTEEADRLEGLEGADTLFGAGGNDVLVGGDGEPLEGDDKRIHDQGLISTLWRIHDQIDAAVAAAYGWPADLPEEIILERLVALNKERAGEEMRGLIRWLRPEFQNPAGNVTTPSAAQELDLDVGEATQKPIFSDAVADRARAVRSALIIYAKPATAEDIARTFKQGARVKKSVRDLLATMAASGQARSARAGILQLEGE